MSMNFGREQALLRQKLGAAASPERAAALQQASGSRATFLGAEPAAVQTAAAELVAAHPQIGRAQMTAFVRTLWRSRIHELRAVGAELLAARATLLEPADLPFLEELLGDCDVPAVTERLASAVLGDLVRRHKKLWKDLKRIGGAAAAHQRRAALLACREPLLADDDAFARFAELGARAAADHDPLVLEALDAVLAAVASRHAAAVRDFAAAHGRKIAVPDPNPEPKAADPVVVPKAPPPARPAKSPRAASTKPRLVKVKAKADQAPAKARAAAAKAPPRNKGGKSATGKPKPTARRR